MCLDSKNAEEIGISGSLCYNPQQKCKEGVDLIPEYCKNHLSSEIADGKVYWTLSGRLNSIQLDTDENKGVRK